MFKSYPDGRVAPPAPPMMAKEVENLPRGEDWVYEFLWGGERIRAIKRDESVHLISRDGREITNRFPRIAASVAKLRSSTAILDGEILYLDTYSEPAVRFLAGVTDDVAPGSLALLVYDLLCDDGKDIRQFSLLCRRLLLASAVQGTPIILSPLIAGHSDAARTAASRLGFRGVVAKRAGSPYRPSSLTCDWLKTTFPPEAARVPTQHPFGKLTRGQGSFSPAIG